MNNETCGERHPVAGNGKYCQDCGHLSNADCHMDNDHDWFVIKNAGRDGSRIISACKQKSEALFLAKLYEGRAFSWKEGAV